MSTVTIGLEGVLYILSTGTRASWSESATDGVYTGPAPADLSPVNVVRDVTLNLSAGQADVSSRASVWKLLRKSLKEASYDLEIPWAPADANFILLRNSYVNDTTVAIAGLDGDKATVGSQGFWADMEVMEFTREEMLSKEMIAKVKLSPTASAVSPQWVEVAGS